MNQPDNAVLIVDGKPVDNPVPEIERPDDADQTLSCTYYRPYHMHASLGPSAAAGIGALLKLDTDTVYQAIQHALHVTCTTRQSRKGEISSWKANAPAHAGKLAIEAVDRAMRGEKSPSPIYEGEDSVVARMLGGPQAEYQIPLP